MFLIKIFVYIDVFNLKIINLARKNGKTPEINIFIF